MKPLQKESTFSVEFAKRVYYAYYNKHKDAVIQIQCMFNLEQCQVMHWLTIKHRRAYKRWYNFKQACRYYEYIKKLPGPQTDAVLDVIYHSILTFLKTGWPSWLWRWSKDDE